MISKLILSILSLSVIASLGCSKSSRDNPDRRSRFEARQRYLHGRGGFSGDSDYGDYVSPGGEAGVVELNGNIGVVSSTTGELSLPANIKVNFVAGLNSQGVRPESTETVALNQLARVSYVMKNTDVVASYNCDEKELRKVVGKDAKIASFESLISNDGGNNTVEANAIYICGEVRNFTPEFFIRSNHLVFWNTTLTIQENSADAAAASESDIRANWFETTHLELVGQNKIISQHPAGTNHYTSAAGVYIDVKESVDGSGTLEINSIGTDYNQ